jgi:hypothetical protein
MEKTPEDEEFERVLAKIDWRHTPSKESQLVSLRRWEIDKMIKLAVLEEREECAKLCEEQYEHYGHDHVFAKAIRARGQE